ncbi:MAG: ExeM/NucH family extracellular endonuclease [Actinomycetota bacterium]|nr:ExeM/NucH family extracellular endonuclease [Actinomycetota bacterium]
MAVAASLLVLGVPQSAGAVSPDIVISQVYGAGGNTGATLTNDFVELYNRGTTAVDLTGWSVQYASATGTGTFAANSPAALSATLPAGAHYLVQLAGGANGAAPPTPDATGTINMSGSAGKVVAVRPGATLGLACNGSSDPCDAAETARIADLVGYGGANFFETAPTPALTATTAALRAADGATDTDNNSADFTVGTPNPRNCGADCTGEPPPPPPCDPPPTFEIAAIQGESTSTPIPGQCVLTEGVVTGDFNGTGGLGGFYIQDDTPDTNPATSDGIFVASTTAVSAGDRVQVDGTAAEANGQTQLSGATVTVTGTGSIAPMTYDLPRPAGTTFEPVEGVLLTFPEALTVTELFQLGRFGELAVSSDGRLFQPTDRVEPGPAAQALAAENALRRLLVDDGSNVQNPPVVPYSEPDTPRIGDTTTGLTGVVGFGFSNYRLQPTGAVTFADTNPRPAAPEDVGGDIQVASFNTLNYFTTLTTENPNARGANSQAEFDRQQIKEVEAILGIGAEVLGLMEVENNGTEAIASLVQALNDATAPGTYAYITEPVLNAPNQFGGTFGTDAIKTAIIYQPAAVTPVGAAQSSADPIFDRPPLIQTFERVGGSEPVTVVVNHFKSKNCGTSSDPGDADQGDGQSCFNARRVAQANALLSALGTLNAPRPLIIGDLNAYTEEDPIHVLEDAGYVGLSEQFIDEADRYSFVFDGFSGELDHGLASPDLVNDVTGATIWHINADEALILDYNLDFNRDPTLYEPNAYRSSDHDPLIVGLNLQADAPPAAPVVSVVVGPNAATVSWTAPDDGGSPINGYSVTVRQGDQVIETATVGPDVGSYTFGGLTNGVAYQFEVVATNAIGDGPAGSTTATPIVPAGYQALDARLACPGFTVTNPNAFPVSYRWSTGGLQGFGVVEAGQTEPVVGADAAGRRTTLIVRTSARPVDDRVTGRC